MAATKKPLPTLVIPASASKAKLSYAALRSLWINAGGSPALASQMAAVALAETGGNPADPWKVGYYQGQRGGKTVTFKSTQDAAKAAVSDAAGPNGLSYWNTYSTGASQPFYRPTTPAEKSSAKSTQLSADASNPTLAQQRAQVSTQTAIATDVAKQTAHVSDPWVTVTKDSSGKVTGFGSAYGVSPPADVLLIGGQPATKSFYQQVWGSNYENVYEAYTGQTPTAAQQADILSKGVSVYTLQQTLSKQPGFTQSPVYKANAAGITEQAKQALGSKPSSDFVRRAVAENWDANTLTANIRALPAYQKGPEFKSNLADATSVYTQTFGAPPPPDQQAWLHEAALQGWSTALIQQRLRAEPAYKQQYAGLQAGIANGLTPNEQSYRAYTGQLNNLYQQYHGTTATPAEIATHIQRGDTAQTIGARFGGQAYVAANGQDVQRTLGAFGGGQATPQQLAALGNENAPGGGLDTPLGQIIKRKFDLAQQRMQGAFKGVLASPALSLASGHLAGPQGSQPSDVSA